MLYRLAADAVVLVHGAFILFVVAGGLLVARWRFVAYLHLPAALWAVVLELRGWICPLTPLEVYLRQQAGDAGYAGGFIEHYLIPLIYPGALTRSMQIGLGLAALALNVGIYSWVLLRRRQADPSS